MALRHLDLAYGLARRLLGNAQDAEDAIQEASIRAFRSMDQIRTENSKAWFLAIVRNCCLNILRTKSSREKNEVEQDDQVTELPSPNVGPEGLVLRRFEVETVQDAIDRLSPSLRSVLILREYEQLSYDEIAEVLRISRGTVMSRLFRARERLAQQLNLGEEEK